MFKILGNFIDNHPGLEIVLWILSFFAFNIILVFVGPVLAATYNPFICFGADFILLIIGGLVLGLWLCRFETYG